MPKAAGEEAVDKAWVRVQAVLLRVLLHIFPAPSSCPHPLLTISSENAPHTMGPQLY